ncbi:caspase family protein [Marinobacterium mangrovicola]|uniref:WD domain G-beta repeat uncharacterized protein n=1 Tax=Marinobacterium mangrovicola TaxID=1476959 RepID=A0A4R1GMM7_9GAMM|nr:caspase family protein [Marinobacterium mangrovicola]TCK08360.1 WD domain G-beta repeat uncharacterized protein [Marinobacterium mangrovicola]
MLLRLPTRSSPIPLALLLTLLTVPQLVAAVEPDYRSIPQEVLSLSAVCDTEQLDADRCAERLRRTYNEAIMNQAPELELARLAEAASRTAEMASDQLGFDDGNRSATHRVNAMQFTQQALNFYNSAQSARMLVMLHRLAKFSIAPGYAGLSPAPLEATLAQIDQFTEKLPEQALLSKAEFSALGPQFIAALINQQGFDQRCSGDLPQRLKQRFETAREAAERAEAWRLLVDLRLSQPQVCSAEMGAEYSLDNSLKQAEEIAHTRGLTDIEVNLKLGKAGITEVDAPGSAQVAEARSALDEAATIAQGSPELELQVLLARARLSMALGEYASLLEQTEAVFEFFQQHQAQLEAKVDPASIAALIEHAAITSFQLGRYQDAEQLQQVIVTLRQRFAPPAEMRALNHNLALYRALGGDTAALDTLEQFTANPENERLWRHARHNLAEQAYAEGEITAALDWLQPLAEQDKDAGEIKSGYYSALYGLLLAVDGQVDRAKTWLELGSSGFGFSDGAIQESLIALAQQAVNPSALQLRLEGELLQPNPIRYFDTLWFKHRKDNIQSQAAVLKAEPMGAGSSLPRLTVDVGHERSSAIWRAVTALALTHDGQQAISCGDKGRCTLWESDSGRTLRQFQAGDDAIVNLAISPDDRLLLTQGFSDNRIRVWDLDTGRELAQLRTDSSSNIETFALTGDGRYIAALQDQFIYLWDTNDFTLILARSRQGFATQTGDAKLRSLVADSGSDASTDALLLQFAPDPKPIFGDLSSNPETVPDTTATDPAVTAIYRWHPERDQLEQVTQWQEDQGRYLVSIAGEAWLSGDGDRRKPGQTEAEACAERCRLPDLSDFAKPLQALGFDATSASINQSEQLALVADRSGQLLTLTPENLVARHTPKVRQVKAAFWQPQTETLEAVVKTFAGDAELIRWDTAAGRVASRLEVSSLMEWQRIDAQLWGFQSLDLQRLDSDSGTLATTELPRWDEEFYPDIVALGAAAENQLWSLESNGYYGDKNRLKARLINAADPADAQLMPWQLDAVQWLALDAGGERLLVRDEAPWGQPTTARWLDLHSGKTLTEFSLEADLNDLEPQQLTLIPAAEVPAADGVQLLIALRNELQLRSADGALLWRQPSTLGEIAAVAPASNGEELAVVINASSMSFIQRFRTQDGQLLDSRVFDGQIEQLTYSSDDQALLSATPDGTLQLWPNGKRDFLASLMHLGSDEWLVIDPQGRYDSDRPGDIDAVSWVLPDAPRQALPLQAFMRDYYEPGLLGRLLAGEQLQAPTPLLALNRAPSEVEILAATPTAEDPLRVDVQIRIRQTRTADGEWSGARDLRLFRDGQLVGFAPRRDGELPMEGDETLISLPGIQLPATDAPVELSAYAFNRDGIRSERSALTLTPQTSTAATSPRVAYLLTIGVNEYENSAWNLRYAANDARQMQAQLKQSLEASGAFDEVVSVPLISDSHSQPGERATKAALQQRLAAFAETGDSESSWLQGYSPDLNDSLFISFSGHGYVHNDGQFYFMLEDIGAGTQREINDTVLANALSSDELARWLRPIDMGEFVMIVDACHSAAGIASPGFKPGPMGSRGLGQLAYDKAMIFLAASQAEQFALESDNLRHGFLSYALLSEGLAAGRADYKPADGRLGLLEWLNYGSDRVPEMIGEMARGEFNPVQRGLSVSRPTTADDELGSNQKPYLFDFRHEHTESLYLNKTPL